MNLDDDRLLSLVHLAQFADPAAGVEGFSRGFEEGRGIVKEQILDGMSHRLVRGPAVEALSAQIPIQNTIVEAANDDGIPGIVEKSGLLADVRVCLAALQFRSGAGREDIDGGINEAGFLKRLAKHHG